jgi:hypothetical protein
VCEAVHVIDAVGAKSEPFAGVHDNPTANVSVTVTLCNVTFPSFVATIV